MTNGKRQVLISGAGPSGLAAAMLFHQYGWEDIIVLERSESSSSFVREKAFNYQIDPRGQQLLERLGIKEMLYEYGLPNDDFTLTFVKPDGTQKTIKPPIIDPNRGTAFWTRRNDFIRMLQIALDEQNTDGRIRLLYGHKFEDIEMDSQDNPKVIFSDTNGNQQHLKPDLVIGCDGLHSAVRVSLQKISDLKNFAMIKHPSPASKLAYKVLNFPSKFTVKGGLSEVDDHKRAFAFISSNKNSNDAFSLFALPVAKPDAPRSINLIRLADHNVWKISEGEELLKYLEDAIPQLDIRSLISASEAEDFASIKPGRFPDPQYCLSLYKHLGSPEQPMHCILIGDSAHSFPPDLGLGVNSSLEDLIVLDQFMTTENGDLPAVFSSYERHKIPENAALVKLVQTVHPYQYNQIPWRLKTWTIAFLFKEILHKLSLGFLDRHAFALIQNHDIPYTEVERRKNKTNRLTSLIGIVGAVLFVFAINS